MATAPNYLAFDHVDVVGKLDLLLESRLPVDLDLGLILSRPFDLNHTIKVAHGISWKAPAKNNAGQMQLYFNRVA